MLSFHLLPSTAFCPVLCLLAAAVCEDAWRPPQHQENFRIPMRKQKYI